MEGVRYGTVGYHIVRGRSMVRYGAVPYRMARPQKSHFLKNFGTQKLCLAGSRTTVFGPANFMGPKLREQGGTLDDLQTDSFSFVFSSFSP
jgi:hypothetical protein